MGYQSILLLALIFATSASLSQGYLIHNQDAKQAKYAGKLCCSGDGNPLLNAVCPGVGGVNVTVACDVTASASLTIIIGHSLTNPDGSFEIYVNNLDQISFDIETSCFVKVQLPATTPNICSALSTITGYLKAAPVFNSVVNLVVQFTVQAFVSLSL